MNIIVTMRSRGKMPIKRRQSIELCLGLPRTEGGILAK